MYTKHWGLTLLTGSILQSQERQKMCTGFSPQGAPGTIQMCAGSTAQSVHSV